MYASPPAHTGVVHSAKIGIVKIASGNQLMEPSQSVEHFWHMFFVTVKKWLFTLFGPEKTKWAVCIQSMKECRNNIKGAVYFFSA
jgi:hypothetical protein